MGRKRTKGSAVGAGAVALALLALVALSSCPTPIDNALLRLVEDDIPPELTISEPVANSLYGATVRVSGTLSDSAFAVGDAQGRLNSLGFGVPSDPTLAQLVSFDDAGGYTLSRADPSFTYDRASGAFAFEFSTVGLSGGPKVLAFSAEDFNGNTSERALTLLEDLSGPYVNVASPANLSNYDITVNLTGSVTNSSGDPSTNDVKLIRWECLQAPLKNGSWEAPNSSSGLTYDTATGEFSAGFSTIGLSGTIAVRLYADDYAGHRTEVNVQLLDNRPGPAIEIQTWPSLYSSSLTTSVAVSGRVQNADIDWTQFAYQAYGASGFTSGVITNHAPELIGTPPFQVPTGYDLFSFSFNPKTSGITGLLTIKVQATDTSGSRDSEKSVTVADDPVKPTFTSSSLAADNSYLDIVCSEAVFTNSNGTGALVLGDFSLSFSRNGGSATGASISGVSMTAANTARLTLNITGTPSGLETVTVTPAGNSSIYDVVGNAMAGTQSTGALTLHDALVPTITSASMASDNHLDVYFSEPVYTNSDGSGTLAVEDFSFSFAANGGGATVTGISSVSMPAADHAHLVLGITGTPSGVETVTVTPAGASSIYDVSGNAMAAGQSTGAVTLRDKLAPTISPAACSLASDNSYLEVVCSEGVYTNSDGTGNLGTGDFDLTFRKNSGTATGAALASVTRLSASTWRLNLTISGTPNGDETVEATPATGSSIYDASGNAMADTQSTGEQNLNP